MSKKKSEGDLYCICKSKYVEGQFMIECGKCNGWFHGSCIGIEEYQAQDIDVYHCPECQVTHGPLVLKKRRNISRHNYKDIHDGVKQISAGTVTFVRQLKTRKFIRGEEVVLQLTDGTTLTGDLLQDTGFKQPILVTEKDGLDIKVPPSNFTIYDVEQHVGSMFDLHVIDVSRQEDLRMKMREWTEYYNSPVRGKVLNVISLEFSNTSLSELVCAPEIVRNISWVENVWPKTPHPESHHTLPVVAKYCLMSVKDCYTDFHVDFGGTSVWYHIVRGEKIFYLIEPTDENLKLFGQWVSSSDQGQVFFGDKVDKCYKICINQGNTFFIPTGWIHAVLTPKDSLVFGGNFLHSFNIPLQQKIYKLEKSLKTPLKFLFPNFETTNWYAARSILKKMKEIHSFGYRIPSFLRLGVYDLILALKLWTAKKDEYVKFHKLQVPIEINPLKIIKNLEKELKIDSRITTDQKFSKSQMPCPAILNETTNSKTILKLRLPKTSESEDSSSQSQCNSPERNLSIRKLKKKEEQLKRKERLLKKEEERQIKKGEVINKIRLQLNNTKTHCDGDTSESESELESVEVVKIKLKDEESSHKKIKLKLSLPPDHPRYATYGEASTASDSTEASPERQLQEAPSPTSHYIKPISQLDIKAEIEAAKQDLFTSNSTETTTNNLYFTKQDIKNDIIKPVTFNPMKTSYVKPKPDLDDEENGGYIIDTLPKPQSKVKVKVQSDDDGDYDPSDDAYYQDAEFVYPRIDVTSELGADDFAWNPSKRKQNRTTSMSSGKRKGSGIRLKKESTSTEDDAFFAPDSDIDDEILSPTEGLPKRSKVSSTSSLGDIASAKERREKAVVKKGTGTAKQRLGKLLKLHKTGSRYIRK